MKSNAIGIIGMGWVGSSVAISTLQRGICKELLLNDIKPEIAEGEAMDLNHGSSYYPAANVRAVSIKEMLHCEAIVITAGRGGKPGESRLDLLNDNILIAKAISQQLVGYKGILLIVANPVDVLTYYYHRFTGLPSARVIGTGTVLDTVRLREMISNQIHIEPQHIHAHVLGEHGDSEAVIWSGANVSGVPLRNWQGWLPSHEEKIENEVRKAAYQIIKRKGATNHAIGLVTAHLLQVIVRDERRILPVSSVHERIFGFNRVALSLPSVISSKGIEEVIEIPLSEREFHFLKNSAQVLQNAIQSSSHYI